MSENENIVLQNEENVIIATFNITSENTTIVLKNLTGMTNIDWGDGTINNELSHTYAAIGEYNCKIYDVTSIGDSAFYNCSSLTSIEIPGSVTSIGERAFGRCSSLTSIVIPDSVTSIGEGAFSNCSSLQYKVEGNVKYLGNANNPYVYLAKAASTSIKTATINSQCKFIADKAFYNCSSLTSIEIPDSVTSIGDYAFGSCSSLTSVTIGDSVTSIGSSAFSSCDSLKHVSFRSFTSLSSSIMSDSKFFSNSTRIFYVPEAALETYRTTWGTDKDIRPYDIYITLDGLKTYHTMATEEMQRYVQQYIRDNFATLMAEYEAEKNLN